MGGAGPQLTQSRLGPGLPPYQVASNTMWPGPRPTCMPSIILMHPTVCATVWPQYTNVTDNTRQDRQWTESTGRTVLQTVAQRTKASFVTYYDIWTGNGEGLFWFWCFINMALTYSPKHIPTYLQPRDHMGHKCQCSCLQTLATWMSK